MYHMTPNDAAETTETLYVGPKRKKLPAGTVVRVVKYRNGWYVVETPLGTFTLRADLLRPAK